MKPRSWAEAPEAPHSAGYGWELRSRGSLQVLGAWAPSLEAALAPAAEAGTEVSMPLPWASPKFQPLESDLRGLPRDQCEALAGEGRGCLWYCVWDVTHLPFVFQSNEGSVCQVNTQGP